MKILSTILSLIFLINSLRAHAQDAKMNKTATIRHYYEFAPNNSAIWFSNNGDVAFNPKNGGAGWEWPKGSKKQVGFEAGLVYGGYHNGQLRVGGSTYDHGWQAGIILPNGKPANTSDTTYRIYHVKREDAIYKSNPDYLNWPSRDGAPMDSARNPSLFGDEQIWFVSNDLDTTLTKNLYGTVSIGLEIQTTAWAFVKNTHFEDVIFVRHLMINKSSFDLKDAYVGLWSDFDLGEANDDFVGVDTLLQLSYVYNGIAMDHVYGIPPAAGMMFLQTPIISSQGDTVFFNRYEKVGYQYCPQSGYSFYIGGGNVYKDPQLRQQAGASEIFNNMKGQLWNGNSYIDPTTGTSTKFSLAGDPVTRSGWIDGIVAYPGDRRGLLGAGPFTLARGDTQEIVYAMLAARGAERLNSLVALRHLAKKIRSWYPENLYRPPSESPPVRYQLALHQNYPNPFNSATTIRYAIPEEGHARLVVRNVLGNVIETLVDRIQSAGEFVVRWDAGNVPSGVYFYEFAFNGETGRKKMVVLK